MGGIIGGQAQLIKIRGKWYKTYYGLSDDHYAYIDKLRSGEQTEIPEWLYDIGDDFLKNEQENDNK